MSDGKSLYPRIVTGYAFTPVMNNDLVGEFNNQTFKQGTAILKIMYCNSKNLIVQHIPVEKSEQN